MEDLATEPVLRRDCDRGRPLLTPRHSSALRDRSSATVSSTLDQRASYRIGTPLVSAYDTALPPAKRQWHGGPCAYRFCRRGGTRREPRERRAGMRDVACLCGRVSAEHAAESRIPIRQRSSTGRCDRPRPGTAPGNPCRFHRMPPVHECFGERHYPCASPFANEDRRRR